MKIKSKVSAGVISVRWKAYSGFVALVTLLVWALGRLGAQPAVADNRLATRLCTLAKSFRGYILILIWNSN